MLRERVYVLLYPPAPLGTRALGLGLGDLQIQYSPLPFITLVP